MTIEATTNSSLSKEGTVQRLRMWKSEVIVVLTAESKRAQSGERERRAPARTHAAGINTLASSLSLLIEPANEGRPRTHDRARSRTIVVSPWPTALRSGASRVGHDDMATPPVFDNDMVLRFVRSYRENQCLWDFNSPTYKNKSARDEAYERLVLDMDMPGLTVLDVKNKIKNIRSTYCQELKKIQTAKMLGREPYVPSVFWFKELDSFLHSNTTPRTDLADRKVPKYLVSSLLIRWRLIFPPMQLSLLLPPPSSLLITLLSVFATHRI